MVNLTDDHFPALKTPKKQWTELATTPNMATAMDAMESLTMINMDQIEKNPE